MSYSFEYIDIILLAMIAGFIFLRLRGILGKKTGFEENINSSFPHEEMPEKKSAPILNAENFVDAAKKDGFAGLVLATRCPTGELCAINRDHRMNLEFPVILVSQDNLKIIQTNGADISFAASVQKRMAKNVIAHFPGPAGTIRVVVTTPISGWFRCAGERGCGLAIAIFVSKQLSKKTISKTSEHVSPRSPWMTPKIAINMF